MANPNQKSGSNTKDIGTAARQGQHLSTVSSYRSSSKNVGHGTPVKKAQFRARDRQGRGAEKSNHFQSKLKNYPK